MAKAYASSVIGAPARDVWAVVRDFNGLPDWHPGIARSLIEDGKAAEQVGCVRHIQLADGTEIRERLLALSDQKMTCVYNFETAPFDVQNYTGTLRCTPITDGERCFIEWWSTFDCEPAKLDEWLQTFSQGAFQTGFDALKARFGG